jgi:hypothetical protein
VWRVRVVCVMRVVCCVRVVCVLLLLSCVHVRVRAHFARERRVCVCDVRVRVR